MAEKLIKSNKSKTTNILTGVAGEYFVAAELSRRGYIASITLRNTRDVDILASSNNTSKQVAIQVKTSKANSGRWMLSEKAEENHSPNLFYIFVDLKNEMERPDFYIVPSITVATFIRKGHRQWLGKMGKGGKPHNDSSVRIFIDEEGKYLEKWNLLGL